ncbi:hypothetical protein [Zooshikella sp. RANM57]|uniref:hypothetical protein n=1 Tax=Zooshikella sp. RANM57 TaxID=3425863 RepID=UPI003D6DC8B5
MKFTTYIVAVIFMMFSAMAFSNDKSSIANREQKLFECLKDKNNKSCFSNLLNDCTVVENLKIKKRRLSKMDTMFVDWLGDDSVFEIYHGKERKIGNIIISRDYIIEDTLANRMLLKIKLEKQLGEWFIEHISISTNSNELKQALTP